MPTAYSYIRFSSVSQAEGDSIRRQTSTRDKWLADHPDVTLDTSLKMTDAGRSAFKRENPETYAMAAFVELVKSGKVKAGSYLLVENLDRLSREEAGEAVELFLSIVNRGVIIVQLMPVVLEFRKPVNTMQLMFAIVELSRGHSESAAKSVRSKEVWGKKQREAKPGQVITNRLPTWITNDDGTLVLNEHADTVRRIFDMVLAGDGCVPIANKLNAEKVPVMGRTEMKGKKIIWGASVVKKVVQSRATMGEYERDGHGEPVAGYYPAIIDADTWHRAQAALARRSGIRGGRGSHVNLFSNLMIDVETGSTISYSHQANTHATLFPVDAREDRTLPWWTIPADQFEVAVLSQLREISVADVTGEQTDTAKRVAGLEAAVTLTEERIAYWTGQMDDLSIAATVKAKLSQYATDLERQKRDLASARSEAANPMSWAVDEMKTVLDVLQADNSNETREKVRAAIRRVVTRVKLAVKTSGKSKGMVRAVGVRVEFAGQGRMREYMIIYRVGKPMFVRSAGAAADCDPKAKLTKTFQINMKQLEKDYIAFLLKGSDCTIGGQEFC